MNRTLVLQLKDYARSFFRPVNLLSVPDLVERPPGSNIVVLSPHFDDDVLGCGGTLYKHARAGERITIVYLTDGRQGDPACPDKKQVERTRKEEARRATGILGIDSLVFLDQPETNLRPVPCVVEQVADLLATLRPDLIYLPSFLENHVDHFEANRILLRAASALSPSCGICAYECWTPLLPNLLVNITEVLSKKREAAEQYVSQNRQVNYVDTILGLNRYRSVSLLEGRGYAEAFLFAPAREYLALLRRLGVAHRALIDRRALTLLRSARAMWRAASPGGEG